MEKSKRSEATLTVRMKHEDDYGMNEDSNLSHSVRASKQGRQSKDDDTNWQQRRETTKTKDLQCMMAHTLASTTLTDFPSVSRHFTRCLGREFLREIHTAKNGLVRCCLYTHRRLQQTAVSCKRSNYKKRKNRESRTSEV